MSSGVRRALAIDPHRIGVTCGDTRLGCALYSLSMALARVVARLDDAERHLLGTHRSVRLSLGFTASQDRGLTHLHGKAVSVTELSAEGGPLYVVSIELLRRPPDHLIERLGELLQARRDADRRRDTRVTVDQEAIVGLGLRSKQAQLSVEGALNQCFLRDLSFRGSELLTTRVDPSLVGHVVQFVIPTDDATSLLEFEGRIVRCEPVTGSADLCILGIEFDEQATPADYLLRLSRFLRGKA